MGYFEVLALPLVTFWSFNRQVDRLRAESEQRNLRVIGAGSCDDPKAAKELGEVLQREIGVPVITEKQFDSSKFDQLQAKFSKGRVVSDTHKE